MSMFCPLINLSISFFQSLLSYSYLSPSFIRSFIVYSKPLWKWLASWLNYIECRRKLMFLGYSMGTSDFVLPLVAISALIWTIFSRIMKMTFSLHISSRGAVFSMRLLMQVPRKVLLMMRWQFKNLLLLRALRMLMFLPYRISIFSTWRSMSCSSAPFSLTMPIL